MKTFLIVIGYMALAFYFSACAGGGGSAATAAGGGGSPGPTTTVAPINYQYRFTISRNGGVFSAIIYTNWYGPGYTETDIGSTGVGPAGYDNPIFGKDTVYQIVNHGSVPLNVIIYKDGPPYSTQTPLVSHTIPVGQSINANDGI